MITASKFYFPILLVLTSWVLNAQIAPCLDGTQESCKCNTTPVICTPDELDGVVLPMSTFRHPQDAPNPICNGQGAPDNPSWIGFTAWCESFSVKLKLDNCTGMCQNRTSCRPGIFPCGLFGGPCSFGVQVAVYESCDFRRAVACDVNECRENEIIFNLENLIPGNTYYFMVDGCNGSACEITFEVLEFCGRQILPPWESKIEGPTSICQENLVNYSISEYSFADNYHWFINGEEVLITKDNSFSTIFDSVGTYELCVDISSGDCVFVEDLPISICQNITVFDIALDSLVVQSSDFCPNQTVFIQSFYSILDTATFSQILILDSDQNIISSSNVDTLSWIPTSCGDFTIVAFLNIDNSLLDIDNFSLFGPGRCSDTLRKNLKIIDSQAPTFIDVPDDMFLECYLDLPPLDTLMAADNCLGSFMVLGAETLPNNFCEPHTWQRTWSAMDLCGNTTTVSQNITILDSFPASQWVFLPQDTIIECEDIPLLFESLKYSNFANSFLCAVSGEAIPQVSENIEDCVGDITVKWEFEDVCGRKIMYIQNIQVICSPSLIPEWTSDIQGEVFTCLSDSLTYIIGEYIWEASYNWTLNNSLIENENRNRINIAFSSEGDFELCVDISRENCFQIDDLPEKKCININVFEVSIDSISVQSSTFCPIEPIFIQSYYSDYDTTFFSHIAILDNDKNIVLSTHNDTLTWTPLACGTFEVVSLLTVDPVLVDNSNIFNFIPDRCSAIRRKQIDISDTEPPIFTDVPDDMFLECYLDLPPLDTLMAADNCLGSFMVLGAETLPNNFCEPHTWQRTWSAMDLCGNTTTVSQNITILDSFPASQWVFLPQDTIIECEDIPLFFESLKYSNFANSFLCEVSGEAIPQVSENIEDCVGDITVTWEFEDVCGRKIMYNQVISIAEQKPTEFYIPDIFKPQSTLGNNSFYIGANKNLKIEEFVIWDRWGSKIFEQKNINTNEPEKGWEGTFNGKRANEGVYIYRVVASLNDGNKKYLQGSVTLLH